MRSTDDQGDPGQRRPARETGQGDPSARRSTGDRTDGRDPGREPAVEGEDDRGPVSTLELFFDLVFVFTFTQLTRLLTAELSWAGLGRVLLLFGVLWWMYGGYAWLTNALPPERPVRRLLLLAAMGGFLLVALAIPSAYADSGVALGFGYLLVVLVHAGLFAQTGARRGILQLAPFNLASAALVLAAGFFDGPVTYAFWAAALAVLVISTLALPPTEFTVRPTHFVERHGLLMIVAFGESIVAVGIGAAGLPLGLSVASAALLGLALSSALWWVYFGGDDERALASLLAAPQRRRSVLAVNAYFYAHVPMLLGIVVMSTGVEYAIAHATDPLDTGHSLALAGGVALYLVGDIAFRRALRIPHGGWRIAAAALALATVPLGMNVTAIAELLTLVALLAATILVEWRTRTTAGPHGDVPTDARGELNG